MNDYVSSKTTASSKYLDATGKLVSISVEDQLEMVERNGLMPYLEKMHLATLESDTYLYDKKRAMKLTAKLRTGSSRRDSHKPKNAKYPLTGIAAIEDYYAKKDRKNLIIALHHLDAKAFFDVAGSSMRPPPSLMVSSFLLLQNHLSQAGFDIESTAHRALGRTTANEVLRALETGYRDFTLPMFFETCDSTMVCFTRMDNYVPLYFRKLRDFLETSLCQSAITTMYTHNTFAADAVVGIVDAYIQGNQVVVAGGKCFNPKWTQDAVKKYLLVQNSPTYNRIVQGLNAGRAVANVDTTHPAAAFCAHGLCAEEILEATENLPEDTHADPRLSDVMVDNEPGAFGTLDVFKSLLAKLKGECWWLFFGCWLFLGQKQGFVFVDTGIYQRNQCQWLFYSNVVPWPWLTMLSFASKIFFMSFA